MYQLEISLKSCRRASVSSQNVDAATTRTASPAYTISLLLVIADDKLFIYTLNRSRPKILPCGTPRSMVQVSDISPFIHKHWWLSARYDSNNLRLLADSPICSSFPRSSLWLIESNALDISRNSIPVTFCPSMASRTKLFSRPTACAVLRPRLNPYWCLYKKPASDLDKRSFVCVPLFPKLYLKQTAWK